jgi:hypothetical protein
MAAVEQKTAESSPVTSTSTLAKLDHSMSFVSQLQSRLKRKADALPHGAKRLAICTVQP